MVSHGGAWCSVDDTEQPPTAADRATNSSNAERARNPFFRLYRQLGSGVRRFYHRPRRTLGLTRNECMDER